VNVEAWLVFVYASAAPRALYADFGDGKIVRSTDAGKSWDEVASVPALDALAAVRA
jgi:hypothetical protein